MLGWVIAGLTLLWGIYQHFHPRVLCKLHYRIDDVTKDNHLVHGIAGTNDHGEVTSFLKHADLIGKEIEIRSIGTIAAKGILVHIRMKYPITHWEISTDEAYTKPYGDKSEFNLKIDNLNTTDVIRVQVFCNKDHIQSGEELLVDHRVSISEGKAKKVKHW